MLGCMASSGHFGFFGRPRVFKLELDELAVQPFDLLREFDADLTFDRIAAVHELEIRDVAFTVNRAVTDRADNLARTKQGFSRQDIWPGVNSYALDGSLVSDTTAGWHTLFVHDIVLA